MIAKMSDTAVEGGGEAPVHRNLMEFVIVRHGCQGKQCGKLAQQWNGGAMSVAEVI